VGLNSLLLRRSLYVSFYDIVEGKVPAIKGGRGVKKADKTKEVGVGKKGSIIISKDLVEILGIGAEDKFTVRRTKAGIALNRVKE
jgi:hypothetical protein